MTTTFPQLSSDLTGDSRIKVMLADGDTDDHALMSAFAADWAPQLDFSFAHDGVDLLVQLAVLEDPQEFPDVIVLNYEMPRYDGFLALCELQAHQQLWQIPVIVLSDRLGRDIEVSCYRAGARWFQQRPTSRIEMGELLMRVEEFAGRADIDLSGSVGEAGWPNVP